ncbi:hypothetical protein TRFO_25287 [Tritrichomonas foetus]|uniref:SCP domain-containing protein n=1 Tax=Tritrichomonas foetus TaxID=1144522 RepID=A0A1J4K588_9EUKA|nr:hypothetical protein TRFO_25287 [Tritrichomonas foetus]|eukprot:OHT06617.1 hypothetical protein TRFO_25287 [Tritrichomonas foetus]
MPLNKEKSAPMNTELQSEQTKSSDNHASQISSKKSKSKSSKHHSKKTSSVSEENEDHSEVSLITQQQATSDGDRKNHQNGTNKKNQNPILSDSENSKNSQKSIDFQVQNSSATESPTRKSSSKSSKSSKSEIPPKAPAKITFQTPVKQTKQTTRNNSPKTPQNSANHSQKKSNNSNSKKVTQNGSQNKSAKNSSRSKSYSSSEEEESKYSKYSDYSDRYDEEEEGGLQLQTIVKTVQDDEDATEHENFRSIVQNESEPKEKLISCRLYQYISIADSILRGINMFRETAGKPFLQEDDRLYQVAMDRSEEMAVDGKEFEKQKVSQDLDKYPFVYYCAHSAHYPSQENAFTAVINQWTTDLIISKQILANFNCAGVGVWMNKNNELFFTLILALRSNIGYSYYSGSSLISILLAEKCVKIINIVRHDDFQLIPIKLDLDLSDIAEKFACMDTKEVTDELIKEKIGPCSQYRVSFGLIPRKNLTPKKIVENWANKFDKTKTVFGDFNRVGIGFRKRDDSLYSVCIFTRKLHAAIIDGTETIVDGPIIAQQIADGLNEFRQQHSLPPLDMNYNLCNVAQEHSEYIANGREGLNPLESDFYVNQVEPFYEATDISHMCCHEMSRAPKAFMAKWRNNCDCISVILNQIDDIGVGVCFDKNYVCHVTIIIGAKGIEAQISNVIVKL